MDNLFNSFFPLATLAAVVWGIYKVVSSGIGSKTATGKMICGRCGTRCDPCIAAKGSTLIEVVLWLCFILPGLIYSLWRLSTKRPVCPACGSEQLIPADSPKGRSLIAEMRPQKEQPEA
jgi:hypothetical protein